MFRRILNTILGGFIDQENKLGDQKCNHIFFFIPIPTIILINTCS